MDTIYALSSGQPPAAIAIVRVSGTATAALAVALTGSVPPPRGAVLRTIRDANGVALDRALILFFPAPHSATGEDLLELHLHGGRAVVAAVEHCLALSGLARRAEPGEFTRRALQHGRIDLAQAQGLADLLAAETEADRRRAFAASEGQIGRAVRGWMARVSSIAALIEAALDFSDEDDVDIAAYDRARIEAAALSAEIDAVLAAPTVERLRQGARVVLAGPPNAGKSSLFNAMLARDAAIVTSIAGTTRDVLEAPVARNGMSFMLIDTAGLHESEDEVERIGIERATAMLHQADLILWLGDPGEAPDNSILIHARSDASGREQAPPHSLPVSIHDASSVQGVWDAVEGRIRQMLVPSEVTLADAQRVSVVEASSALSQLVMEEDALIAAEHCRAAAGALGRVLGIDATEAMLDALFGQFCIGK